IALASGTPVPEIYVLEQESGINAFAAGFSPADAAVAVTRGAMEKLSRSELQGVIAHEFSHIFNGDMRLNIRLMGALFGILVLALIGRRVLHHTHYVGRSRDNSGAAILILALALTTIGYLGLFFGRWIKSAVSRQREYLADASAVQFTRDPGSIAGALKKIAVYSDGSYLDVETEEVGHMLFGSGQKMNLFATHPPLMDRIRRVEPSFDESELANIARDIKRKERLDAEREARLAEQQDSAAGSGGAAIFDPAAIMQEIGNPQWEKLLMAAALAASIPVNIRDAARSAEWAPEVLFYTLLDGDDEVRENQLLAVSRGMGGDSEKRVRNLVIASGLPNPEQRLPIMEVALPSLKRHPPEVVHKVLKTVNELISADGRVDVFEYLLARIVSQYLWEATNPHATSVSGKRRLASQLADAASVLAVMARHGHENEDAAQHAFTAAMQILSRDSELPMPASGDWIGTLDKSLAGLDKLCLEDKEKLIRALIEVVTHDGRLIAIELELLRAVCAMLHVPVPMIPPGIASGGGRGD
ncbi:MAG: M48 family metalloprotease, partial [Xanthomonadales bacterium]|nr:M48 family metalloprotease [Xanthomonadales bacterium]